MSAVHEQFSIDREESIKNSIDPTGKKWNVIGGRGSALCHAQSDPGTANSPVPRDFAGKWTSPSVLENRITAWLSKQWDKADEATRISVLKQGRKPLPAAEPKLTPEESLAALDPEILAELGDIIKQEEPEDGKEEEVTEAAESKDEAKADNDKEQTRRPKDTGSKEAKKKVTKKGK